MRIGFVGLGLMGIPMVRNLLRAGHQVIVHSGNPAAIETLRQDGAQAARTQREAVEKVEVFCSCRVTPEQSRDTFLGSDGAMAAGQPGLLCIDFATVDPETSRSIGAGLAARGMAFIDAPISGGPDGATAVTLSIICGGEAAAVERARPLFQVLGKQVFHMGPVGVRVAAKLCNNMITITTHALLAEAMVLGVKLGLDPRRLYEMLRGSSARSNTLERVVPGHFLPRNFKAAASIATITKDLECAVETGRRLGVKLRLPEIALKWYAEAARQGHAEDDIAAVILPMEKIADIKVGPA